jgi:hypothetical protein
LTLASGEKVSATYYLNRKDANGDLALSKGFIRVVEDQQQYAVAEMVYNDLPVWPVNGTYVGGLEDAKTYFYRSNLYRGMFLKNLTGFDLAYESKNGEIKIYRMKDSLFKGNSAGLVDPIESKRSN